MRDCTVCADKGFVLMGGEVSPCPNCNEDSGYAPGEYEAELEAELVAKHGRCDYAKGGGGRTCPLHMNHKQPHVFICGH